MCKLHTSSRPFRESLLRSRNSVAATTFTSTSDQFFSSWRWRPNHTPRNFRGLSLQMKGPGRAQLFHKPNHKPTDFSRLILALVTTSYLPIYWLTSSTRLPHWSQVTCGCVGPGSPLTYAKKAQAQECTASATADNPDKSSESK